MLVESTTIKIAIVIKNGWSLKLHQTWQLLSFCFLLDQHKTRGLWAFGSGIKAGREERSGIWREKEEGVDIGSKVSKTNPSHHTSSLPSPITFRFLWQEVLQPNSTSKRHMQPKCSPKLSMIARFWVFDSQPPPLLTFVNATLCNHCRAVQAT